MKIRYFVTILGVTAGLFLSGFAQAQDYQWEVLFNSESLETDITKLEIDSTTFFANYYFDRVSTTKGPLAEAAFLSRASSVGFGIIDVEISDPTFSVEGDGFIFEGIYYLPNADYFVGFETLRLDIDNASPGEIEDDTLTAGFYLNDRSAVVLYISSGSAFGDDSSGIALAYKTLLKSGGKDINIEAGIASEESEPAFAPSQTNTIVSVSGDYYINNQLSIGAGFSSNGGDDTSLEGTTISFEVLYFFTPAVAFDLEVGEFSTDDSLAGEDDSTVSFTLIGRF